MDIEIADVMRPLLDRLLEMQGELEECKAQYRDLQMKFTAALAVASFHAGASINHNNVVDAWKAIKP